nr:hypothetical protein [Tanacetum cinerariifolium]
MTVSKTETDEPIEVEWKVNDDDLNTANGGNMMSLFMQRMSMAYPDHLGLLHTFSIVPLMLRRLICNFHWKTLRLLAKEVVVLFNLFDINGLGHYGHFWQNLGISGNGYDVTPVETQKSTVETTMMEVPAAENDGNFELERFNIVHTDATAASTTVKRAVVETKSVTKNGKGDKGARKRLIVLVKELPDIAVSQDMGGREGMKLTYGIIVAAKKVKQEKDAKFILGDMTKKRKRQELMTWLLLTLSIPYWSFVISGLPSLEPFPSARSPNEEGGGKKIRKGQAFSWFPNLLLLRTALFRLDVGPAYYEDPVQAALPFFTHAILLDRAFAHCPRFPTAAPRGSPGRVSVPVWADHPKRPAKHHWLGKAVGSQEEHLCTEESQGNISIGGKLGLEKLQAIRICNLVLLAGFVDP